MKAWLFAACVLMIASSAYAQSSETKERARRLFEQGVELAEQEKLSEALEAFEASRDLYERPSTLFNLGAMFFRLERPSEAIRTLEKFIAISTNQDEAGRVLAKKMIGE